MLQIIAFGIGFMLFGIGSMARSLSILATPAEKRRPDTGAGIRLLFIALGILILGLALIQGVTFMG